ncbi:Glucan endo-1,3-beta-glucosidase 5 [Camellia lanceoleosa]|uniref:Glucan endo-1,3-beta-glucosidase 5 n=1 Tax=Camellia lanceoleosa TaxID=1840588 RepID=A0ACC0FF47_9ERIC|nr:Glucan endo-1,3-beta-glucosidase 5 [Camellia lanceoleosa]
MLLLLAMVVGSVSGIGANWGTQATHPLPYSTVVQMLKDNGFQKVKLFDADSNTLNALSGSGLEVMVGIPNDMLYTLANSVAAAEKWVEKNVSVHVSSNKVDIRYVAVGNEPFLATYNGSFLGTTFPALQNIQAALIKAGLGNQVKVTIPLNADVYQTSTTLPSGGDFRPDIHDLMLEIVKFLNDNGGPFTVNIYPFISLYLDSNFPLTTPSLMAIHPPSMTTGKFMTMCSMQTTIPLCGLYRKMGMQICPLLSEKSGGLLMGTKMRMQSMPKGSTKG